MQEKIYSTVYLIYNYYYMEVVNNDDNDDDDNFFLRYQITIIVE